MGNIKESERTGQHETIPIVERQAEFRTAFDAIVADLEEEGP